MSPDKALIPVERIEGIIIHLRGRKVIIDSDLARIYGVSTKKLNQAVKRNIHRFPADFLFQLSPKEKEEVVTICDHLSSLKFSPHLPFAFTEHGSIMAASVLNSNRAIQWKDQSHFAGTQKTDNSKGGSREEDWLSIERKASTSALRFSGLRTQHSFLFLQLRTQHSGLFPSVHPMGGDMECQKR